MSCAQLGEALVAFPSPDFPDVAPLQRDIGARGQVREQAAVLNDVADAAPKFHDRSGCDRLAVELDCAAIRFDQADDQAQKGGFAAATRPDQHGGLAALERRDRCRWSAAASPKRLLTPWN